MREKRLFEKDEEGTGFGSQQRARDMSRWKQVFKSFLSRQPATAASNIIYVILFSFFSTLVTTSSSYSSSSSLSCFLSYYFSLFCSPCCVCVCVLVPTNPYSSSINDGLTLLMASDTNPLFPITTGKWRCPRLVLSFSFSFLSFFPLLFIQKSDYRAQFQALI